MIVFIFRPIAVMTASLLLVSVAGSTASAQTQRGYKDPLAPKTSPVDRIIRQHLNRGVPQTKTDRAVRRQFTDPMRNWACPPTV